MRFGAPLLWALGLTLLALYLVLQHGGLGERTVPQAEGPAPASAPVPQASPGASSADAPAPAASASAPSGASAPQPTMAAAPASDPAGDLAAHVPPGQVPTMAEVIRRLHQAGVRTGLGAFNPPGTRPPLIGLAVPEDFVLPPGFVRHHQATDDGQRIEPILMFDPDHPPLDAAGRPVAMPADRLVPPELAPPGLPIRRIAVPPPLEAGR